MAGQRHGQKREECSSLRADASCCFLAKASGHEKIFLRSRGVEQDRRSPSAAICRHPRHMIPDQWVIAREPGASRQLLQQCHSGGGIVISLLFDCYHCFFV
jgi:hypothetical protein